MNYADIVDSAYACAGTGGSTTTMIFDGKGYVWNMNQFKPMPSKLDLAKEFLRDVVEPRHPERKVKRIADKDTYGGTD